MLILLKEKITKEQLESASGDLEGYIKLVIDIEKGIMTVGGKRHVEGEQMLLKDGSKQENLWGGGFDRETEEIDFDSMINIRPGANNPSREVLSIEARSEIEKIVRNFLK